MALLVNSINRALDLLSCRRIVPLYTETVYEGMCTYSPQAVFWVFSSCVVMGFFGMLMLTFRSSYKRTYYTMPEHYDNDDRDALAMGNPAGGGGDEPRGYYDSGDEDREVPPPQEVLGYNYTAKRPTAPRDDHFYVDDDDDDDDLNLQETTTQGDDYTYTNVGRDYGESYSYDTRDDYY